MRPGGWKGAASIAGLLLLLIAAGAGLWLRQALYLSRDSTAAPTRVAIPAGSTVRAAGERLHEAGLLERAWLLRAAHRLEFAESTIKAGAYEISPGSSPVEIARILVAGEVVTIAVTLPEGWMLTRIAAALADSLGFDADGFVDFAQDPPGEMREELDLPPAQGLEGYLFPDTYRFAEATSIPVVVRTMVDRFLEAFDDSLRAKSATLDMSVHEVVTLASIVEAEAQHPDEREKVAAVYRNRLEQNWRLEADPTVAYAAGVNGEDLTYGHLQMDSPYNTYRNRGLPPGPINSPGLAALRAALWPEPGFDALYFVADGEGGHNFSRTWQEHRAAVQEYRRMQRARASGG